MKKAFLFIAVIILLISPLAAKDKIGFGMTLATGPRWMIAADGDATTISDSLLMAIDLHVGANFPIGKKSRILLGFGVRPLIEKGGLFSEIYPIRMRASLGFLSISAGIGFVVVETTLAFSSNFGFGIMINIGKHVGIMVDLLDLSIYVANRKSMLTVNSLVGFNLYF